MPPRYTTLDFSLGLEVHHTVCTSKSDVTSEIGYYFSYKEGDVLETFRMRQRIGARPERVEDRQCKYLTSMR